MLSPHIVSALLVEREADLRRRAEQARLRRPEPWPAPTPTPPTPESRDFAPRAAGGRWRRRRRHLRSV